MTDPILVLLVVLVLALLLVGGLGAALSARSRQAIGFTAAGLCGLGALLSVAASALSTGTAGLDLPLGPPGLTFRLACDPLSGFFLLLLFLAGAAILAFATATQGKSDPGTLAGPIVGVAGLAFALLATDGIGLGLGIAVASLAVWATGGTGTARSMQLGMGLLAAGSIAAAAALAATPEAAGAPLDGLRFAPRGHASGILAFLLVLLAAGALAGLAPMHRWFVQAQRAMAERATALMTGVMAPIGIYVLLRAALPGPGVATPVWWSLPLLALGAATALLGGWRSARAGTLDAVVTNLALQPAGLAVLGVGFVLIAAATDLPALGAISLAAVFLLVAAQTLSVTLLVLAAGAVRQAAGAGRLDQLGGLIHRMPVTTTCIGAALFGLLAFPPASGFAALWLLFHAGLSAPRAGSLLPQLLFVVLVLCLGLSSALGAAASVRLLGVGFLGRPRLPRSSVADELPRIARFALMGLAGLALLVGVFPGVVLRALVSPVVLAMSGHDLGARIGWMTLAPVAGATGYAPLPLALLLALAAGASLWLLRLGRRDERLGSAWSGGFAAPPAWLPFGDPLTQAGGGGFVPDMPRMRLRRPAWVRTLPRRLAGTGPGWTMLAITAGMLLVAAFLEQP
ncbi:MAG: proton-conducting transporter membrane subunit [Acetobacteraceae bacterium]